MTNSKNEDCVWETISLNSIPEILEKLAFLRIHRSQWLFRGQPSKYNRLIPSIDRKPFDQIDRGQKLLFERQSIELFRSTVKLFVDENEREILRDDIHTFMLLQHSGAPTRFLDWSFSPYIAAYFAVCTDDEDGGALWCFDYPRYEVVGPTKWPDISGVFNDQGEFDRRLPSIFDKNYEEDWIVCQFYPGPIRRLVAQEGAFTVTSQFGRDHAEKIRDLLGESKYYQRYNFAIKENLKSELRRFLRKCNIWHGMLYPDTTGVAEGVKEVLQDEAEKMLKK